MVNSPHCFFPFLYEAIIVFNSICEAFSLSPNVENAAERIMDNSSCTHRRHQRADEAISMRARGQVRQSSSRRCPCSEIRGGFARSAIRGVTRRRPESPGAARKRERAPESLYRFRRSFRIHEPAGGSVECYRMLTRAWPKRMLSLARLVSPTPPQVGSK